MNLFSIENPFWRAVNKVLQCVQVSFLWLLFSLPVFTVGASTAALYATVLRFIRQERGYAWQTFWKALKENFKKCTAIWMMVLGLMLVLLADLWIFRRLALNGSMFGGFYWVILVIICIAITWIAYIFCYAARFEGTVKEILRVSFMLFVLHPLKAVMIFLFLAGGAMLTVTWPFLILVLPAAVFWVSSLVLESVFRRHMREEDLEKEEAGL